MFVKPHGRQRRLPISIREWIILALIILAGTLILQDLQNRQVEKLDENGGDAVGQGVVK